MQQINRQLSYIENPNEIKTVIYVVSEREKYIDEAKTIFDYWRSVMNSPRSAFDDSRKRLIKKSLKHYSLQDLCTAIRGCSKSPYHMGQNAQKTKYNGLDLILRNAEKIDKFIELDKGNSISTTETIEEKNARIMNEVIRRKPDDDTFEMDI